MSARVRLLWLAAVVAMGTVPVRTGSGEGQAASGAPPSAGTGSGRGAAGAKVPLYLGGFFAMPGGGWDGSSVLVATEMALDHINASPDILPGYELRMVWDDTRCDAGLGTRLFFEQIRLPPQKLMLIGPACSPTAQAVAQTSFYWNLITMSYSAASSALSNRVVFPYFYRTYMPDAMLNRARVRLIKDFGWQRVATIHENQDLFSLAINDLINLLKAENISVISSESFDEDPTNQVANLKALDARIIVVNMYESKARRVMCQAAKQGMTGPGYVWLLLGWWSLRWWQADDTFVTDCTTAETARAVESSFYIGVESALFGEDNATTVSGVTPLEFDRELRRRMARPEYESFTYNGIATYGYDAAWALALALNASAETMKTKRFSDGSIRRLEDFTYDDKEMSQIFFDAIDKTSFYGVSGPVSFLGADRISITQIEQLRAGCWPSWVQHHTSCYLLVGEPAIAAEATDFCNANDNSHLLVLTGNRSEADFVEGMLRGSEVTQLGRQKWLIGSVADLNVSSSELCLAMDVSGSVATMTEVNCSNPLPYICQQGIEYLEVMVGTYDTARDVLKMTYELQWPDGQVPLDRTPVEPIYHVEVYKGISIYVFVCLSSVAGTGILLSTVFLVFNLRYRSLRIVRMSSPNLNNIILLGTALIYTSVVLYGIDMNLVSEKYLVPLCQIRIWVLAVGFVLAFGAMFSKTWRVHKVVAQKTPKRKVVRDQHLLAMVGGLLFIDVVILLSWQLIFRWRTEKMYLPEQMDPTNASVIQQPYIITCTSQNHVYWSIGLYSYKGLLLIFGAFLAWETRQVRIPALNDSKLIGISVYNVVILCVVGLAINLVLSKDPQTLYIFNSAISIFCTTLTTIIVFLPKVMSVYKNPNKDPMKDTTISTVSRNSQGSSNSSGEVLRENLRLKQKVAELENHLRELQSKRGPGMQAGHQEGSTAVGQPGGSGGPSHAQMKTRACNVGMWCCGMVCGCSPGEIDLSSQADEDPLSTEMAASVAAAHINEVDLSLELTAEMPSTSKTTNKKC